MCQEKRLTGESLDLAEQFAYWAAKTNDGSPDDEGTWLHVAVPVVAREGVCREAAWPYNPSPIPGDEAQGPPPADAKADTENIISCETLVTFLLGTLHRCVRRSTKVGPWLSRSRFSTIGSQIQRPTRQD